MLPEKAYWLVLILGLLIFILLVGFVLIPYEALDYNLGINLVSESTMMLFTIIFLTWLFRLREKQHWKSVKDKVCGRIGGCLHAILLNCTMITNERHELRNLFKKENHVRAIKQMEGFSNTKRVTLDKNYVKIMTEKPRAWASLFKEQCSYLTDIELKYSRYLEPEIIGSILDMQTCLSNIAMVLETIGFASAKRLDGEVQRMIERWISMIIEEIYRLHKVGISPVVPFGEAEVEIEL